MSFAEAFGPPSGAPPPVAANSMLAGVIEDQYLFMADEDMRDVALDQLETPPESAEQIPSQDDINHYAEMLCQMKDELGSQRHSYFEYGEHGGGVDENYDEDDDDDDDDDDEVRDGNNDAHTHGSISDQKMTGIHPLTMSSATLITDPRKLVCKNKMLALLSWSLLSEFSEGRTSIYEKG